MVERRNCCDPIMVVNKYTGKELQDYLKRGVYHELTDPKTPQQNGVVERLNCTLLEMVRTMLIESNLDQRFWGEALSTAIYLRNRSRSYKSCVRKGTVRGSAWEKA